MLLINIKTNMKYSTIIAALLVSNTSAIAMEDDYKLRPVLGALAGDYGKPTVTTSDCGCNVCPCQKPADTKVSSKAAEKAAAKGAAKAV